MLVKIDSCWYDLTNFKHPGGNIIKNFDMKDVTIVYKSIHMKQHATSLLKYLKNIEIKTKQKPEFEFYSEIANEIRKINFKNSNVAPLLWWIRYIIITIMWFYFEYNHYINPNLINSIMLGITFAEMGLCIGHDGSHYSVSKKPWVNEFMALYMDYIGFNRHNWFSQHIVQHHIYTNDSEFDPDTKGKPPYIIIDPEQRIESNRHYFLVTLLGFGTVFDIPRLFSIRNKIDLAISIIIRLIFYVRILYSSVLYGLVVIYVAGFVLSNLFIISHNYEDVSRNKRDICWYTNQIQSSSTYGGKIVGFLTGGLNYQIEHHCFPRMNSMYYPKIQKKLQFICYKHEVKYTYFETFWENFKSMIKHLQF
tara:strand:+ start:4750 stop:5841 length:1092 start_codon:yes stop_codon:yes gene_type:complete